MRSDGNKGLAVYGCWMKSQEFPITVSQNPPARNLRVLRNIICPWASARPSGRPRQLPVCFWPRSSRHNSARNRTNMKNALRPSDFLGRWEGAAILAILMNSTAPGVTALGNVSQIVVARAVVGSTNSWSASLGAASVQTVTPRLPCWNARNMPFNTAPQACPALGLLQMARQYRR